MDWKNLLKKYMKHVDSEEGTTFVTVSYRPPEFDEEEWAELNKLNEEIYADV